MASTTLGYARIVRRMRGSMALFFFRYSLGWVRMTTFRPYPSRRMKS